MKKVYIFLLLMLCLPLALRAQVAINATNFPDANFRDFVRTFDTDGDDYLSDDEIAAARLLNVDNSNITDMTGLEHLSELRTLYCQNNPSLTTLDVSRNTNITVFHCYNCALTSLDVSNLPNLKTFYCYNNQLSSLDVSQNLQLLYLLCYNNNISSLTLPTEQNNIKDIEINISNNPIGSVNLDHYPNLKNLTCDHCELNELNVANNTKLQKLYCNNNKLSKLDVTNNLELSYLYCYNNQLTSLDLTKNTKINSISKLKIYGQKKVVDAVVFDFESIAFEVLPSSSSSTLTKDLFYHVSGPGAVEEEIDYQLVDGKHYFVIGKPKADINLNGTVEQGVKYYFNPKSTVLPNAYLEVTLVANPYVMYVNPASKGLSNSFYSGTIILNYDAVVPEGMEVYVANEVKTADDGSQSLGMKSVGLPGDVIPANTPLYVRATDNAGLYAFARNLSEATPVSITGGNLLQGTLTNKPVSPNAYLTLGIQTELEDETYGEVGFWPFIGTQISAHRCFVDASLVDGGNASNGFTFSYGGETNEVDTLPVSNTAPTVDTWFNLQGVQLTGKPLQKGIYICNGKKVIIK